MDHTSSKLVLSDYELKTLQARLRIKFVLSLLVYCDDPEDELNYLFRQMDKNITTFNDVYLKTYGSVGN